MEHFWKINNGEQEMLVNIIWRQYATVLRVDAEFKILIATKSTYTEKS